jgi:large subunit ribosomal protein L4
MELTPLKTKKREISDRLLAQSVRVHLANKRVASAKTKTRGEVEGSTRKIFRQKGTGRARHGSVRAPIFVGGGISHGPDGAQNFSLVMPKKMRQQAIAMAMAVRPTWILSGADKATGKTREIAKLLEGIRKDKEKVVMIANKEQKGVENGSRNISGVKFIHTEELNSYVILAGQKVVATQEAWETIAKKYVN